MNKNKARKNIFIIKVLYFYVKRAIYYIKSGDFKNIDK